MLSACLCFSLENTANQFVVVIATCFILSQALGAARHFSLPMLKATFAKMENDYFESLKDKEADEAARLEVQLEHVSYLGSLPRPDDLARRKRPMLVCYLFFALMEVVHQTRIPKLLERYSQ